MVDRRKSTRGAKERRHPLRAKARLTPKGPAIERRAQKRADRSRLTVQLPAEVIDRLRNAVYWTPDLTIAGFMERCIVETVDQMEAKRGTRFPERERELPVGRPRK